MKNGIRNREASMLFDISRNLEWELLARKLEKKLPSHIRLKTKTKLIVNSLVLMVLKRIDDTDEFIHLWESNFAYQKFTGIFNERKEFPYFNTEFKHLWEELNQEKDNWRIIYDEIQNARFSSQPFTKIGAIHDSRMISHHENVGFIGPHLDKEEIDSKYRR